MILRVSLRCWLVLLRYENQISRRRQAPFYRPRHQPIHPVTHPKPPSPPSPVHVRRITENPPRQCITHSKTDPNLLVSQAKKEISRDDVSPDFEESRLAPHWEKRQGCMAGNDHAPLTKHAQSPKSRPFPLPPTHHLTLARQDDLGKIQASFLAPGGRRKPKWAGFKNRSPPFFLRPATGPGTKLVDAHARRCYDATSQASEREGKNKGQKTRLPRLVGLGTNGELTCRLYIPRI